MNRHANGSKTKIHLQRWKTKKICFEKKLLTQSVLLKRCRKFVTTSNIKNWRWKKIFFFKLHKNYIQSNLNNRKFDKQRVDLISVLIKVEKLVYKLNISNIWKIHSVVLITHLKFASEKKIFMKKNQSNLNQLKLRKTMKLIFTKSKESLQKELFASKKKNANRIRNLKWNELNEAIIIISEWNEMNWLIAKNYWSNLKQFKEFSFKKFIHFDWSSLKSFKKHNSI